MSNVTIDPADITRSDYYRLRAKQRRLQKQGDADHGGLLTQLEAARAHLTSRQKLLEGLNVNLAPELPVSGQADAICTYLQNHQVVIVAGETGSGKTTQLPKICLQLGLGVRGMIGHTQPRRLAARAVARRIAGETGTRLGDGVGYAVRFSDQVQPQTLLKVMTDGLLLTEIRQDRFLNQYDVLIIDEAHERSLNIDFLLGFLRGLLRRRQDLKVIITSATIDVERFARFFDGAPIVAVGGRSYPVEVRYRATEEDLVGGIVGALEEIDRGPQSAARDVLVFLSGEQEIFNCARDLRRHFKQKFEILPLYARLPLAEQQKIFQPAGGLRRVILATNVAETSLTVPNIGYVIDPGMVRINRYSYRSKLQRLPIEPISQASAEQRKGRCGRVAPGICFRLYEEQDFLSRPAFTDPEIHRVNLASVVLQMMAFKLGQIQKFPFVDPPDPKAVRDAHTLLVELGALDPAEPTVLSKAGRHMARMPIDPRLARMLVEANNLGALQELLVITAALAVPDPRERPIQKAQAADQAHSEFADGRSDFLSYLKLWSWLTEQRQRLTRNRFSRVLKKQFISPQRVQEWREVHRQLRLVCKDLGYRENATPAGFEAVHGAIISGSLSLVAQHDERGLYLGARNLKLRIFPGSGLKEQKPRWLVASEIAETSRVYARNVAGVQPGWIERQAAHLLKHQYSEPYWSTSRGEVMVHKSSLLYGLRLVERRPVSYHAVDPVVCRDLFIREGLVMGQIKKPPEFLKENIRTITAVQELEAKARRRDILVSEDEIYGFYAERLPESINRVSQLNKWLGKDKSRAETLRLGAEDIMRTRDGLVTDDEFPGVLVIQGMELKVSYRFAPGEPDDGMTVIVPVGLLSGISATWLDWSVPGLLPGLVEHWLRTLPKQLRRQLVPLPDKVDELCGQLLHVDQYRRGRLLTALSRLLAGLYKVQVNEADWHRDRLPEHLLPNVRVVDEGGKSLGCARNLAQLKDSLAARAVSEDVVASEDYQQADVQEFPERVAQEQVILETVNGPVIRYPGLVDKDKSVHLRLFADARERDAHRAAAFGRLALKQLGQASTYFRKELDKHPHLGLHFATLGSADELKDELLRSVVWYCFFEDQPLPKSQAEFAQRLQEKRPGLAGLFQTVTAQFAEILALRFECYRLLDPLTSKAYVQSVQDIQAHLEDLVPKNVLAITPQVYLGILPRYLMGIKRRIEMLNGHVPKDRRLMNELTPLLQRLEKIPGADLYEEDIFLSLRFYIEELRLVLFAEGIARTRVRPHPLDNHLGPGWKASTKRVKDLLLTEEQRLGLA